MRFRNPWIDPRVSQARPEDAQAYLARQGWELVGPASDPQLLRYEIKGDENAPTVFVPVRVDSGPGLQWMIDLVADLARFEGRWAVDVLADILREPAPAAAANGPAGPAKAEPAPR
jgi:hypothetical protein